MTVGAQSLERALALLDAIVMDDGRTSVREIAAKLDFAPSSARRIVTTLKRHGWLEVGATGRYSAGQQLASLATFVRPHGRLIEAARPELRRLAQQSGWTAHLGIFENSMVTYLVKEGSDTLFTQEGAQLEAYCTGIGKALLAQIPAKDLTNYLAGSFVPVTGQTIWERPELEAELERTRNRGYAIDDREIEDSLACVAVPILLKSACIGAISFSGPADRFPLNHAAILAKRLRKSAAYIAAKFGRVSRI